MVTLVSAAENQDAKIDGHYDLLTVLPNSSAWPILNSDEAARIDMQMQHVYKVYAFDMESSWSNMGTYAGRGECYRSSKRKK
jgi:hypothetical protein